MKLKKTCPCCQTELTTKNIKSLGKTSELSRKMLWFNCKKCESTGILVTGKRKAA